MRFPAEVSQVSREMSKRMLRIFPIWKVKSLQHQLSVTRKKRKVSELLFTEEAEEDEPSHKDSEAYLDRLLTLFIAYAMEGVEAPPTATPAVASKDEMVLGADSTLFAMVPLDVVLQYFYRAKCAAGAVPAGRRLAWLRARDMEERAEWTSRFREGTASLGVVIKEVALVRDAHWLTPVGVDQPMQGSQQKRPRLSWASR